MGDCAPCCATVTAVLIVLIFFYAIFFIGVTSERYNQDLEEEVKCPEIEHNDVCLVHSASENATTTTARWLPRNGSRPTKM